MSLGAYLNFKGPTQDSKNQLISPVFEEVVPQCLIVGLVVVKIVLYVQLLKNHS